VGRSAFAIDGFARLPGFLGPDELRETSADVQQQIERERLSPNALVPCRWDIACVRHILGSAEKLACVAAAVGASDLRWISAYISTKEPGAGALAWHQDWWCWNHPVTYRAAAPQVALLCYLGDTDSASGALRVLPGSHRAAVPLHSGLPEAHTPVAGSHPATLDQPEQKTVGARAGDAVVVDYRLLHGTHPNTSRDRRSCLLLSFAPDWHVLPDDVKAHLIQHPGQPDELSDVEKAVQSVLPTYDGVRRDLPLSRTAPAAFAIR
jgi:ectoine hydroxylase-related dioxygenase (phytanoyl-CoA dioxygenase family)